MKLPVVDTDIQIRFADLDVLGHVSNHVFGQYFELGRVSWFRQVPDCPPTVVASISTDFLSEVLLDDQVFVRTSCIHKGNKSLKLQQLLYSNGKLAAKSVVVLVGFDKETRKSVAVLDGWEPSDSVDEQNP
jgi:acyl-CoA thioester hydrolase